MLRRKYFTNIFLRERIWRKLHLWGLEKRWEKSFARWESISKQAVFRLKEIYPNTCVVILYHLEAAIRGCEMKQLGDSVKAELKDYFKQL